jgi:hypothetical protein
MKEIIIKIDVKDPDLCGNCHALGHVDLYGTGKFENPSCGVFNEDLDQTFEGKAYRCKSCIDAEKLHNGTYGDVE